MDISYYVSFDKLEVHFPEFLPFMVLGVITKIKADLRESQWSKDDEIPQSIVKVVNHYHPGS